MSNTLMVAKAGDDAALIARDAIVRGALAAAEQLSKMVISDEAQAAMVTDLIVQTRKGQKRLKDLVATTLADAKAYIEGVGGQTRPLLSALDAAIKAGNAANTAWLLECNRRVEAERRRIAEAEAQQREQAAELKLLTGEDAAPEPPPMLSDDVALLTTSSTTGQPVSRGGLGTASLRVTWTAEVASAVEALEFWSQSLNYRPVELRVNQSQAVQAWNNARSVRVTDSRGLPRTEMVDHPEDAVKDGDGWLWHGLFFKPNAGSVTR